MYNAYIPSFIISWLNHSYVLALLCITAGFILRVVFRKVVDRRLSKIAGITRNTFDDHILEASRGPGGMLLVLLGFMAAERFVTLPTEPYDLPTVYRRVMEFMVIIDSAWFSFNLIDALVKAFYETGEDNGMEIDVPVMSFIQKALKSAVVIVAVLLFISNLGYSISSVLAGLGVGGLAVALAAQDMLSNFFGSIMIFADKPFRVNDYVEVSGITGTVESVGLRSTKIRTWNGSLVSIPNKEVANSAVDNQTSRPGRRVDITVGVTYDTTADRMEEALSRLERMIGEHPDVDSDSVLVRFKEFGASSLDIMVSYFTSPVWREKLRVQQEINLLVMRELEDMGLEIAFPSTTVYLKK